VSFIKHHHVVLRQDLGFLQCQRRGVKVRVDNYHIDFSRSFPGELGEAAGT
jgi:hypothetical protein